MTEQLDDVLRDSERLLLEAEAVVSVALRNVLAEVEASADELNTSVAASISQSVIDAAVAVSTLTSKLRDNFTAIIRAAESVVDPIAQTIITSLQFDLRQAQNTISVLERRLADAVAPIVVEAETTDLSFIQRLLLALGGGVDSVLAVLAQFGTITEAAIAEILDRIDQKLLPLIQRVQDAIPTILSELGVLLAGPEGFLTNPIAALGSGLTSGITNLLTGFLKTQFNLGAEQIDPLIVQLEESPELGEIVKQFTGGGLAIASIPGIAFIVALAGALGFASSQALFAGPLTKMTQSSLLQDRPTLMSVPELRELMNRFPRDITGTFDQLRNFGFNEEKIALIAELRFVLLPATESVELWRRGELEETELDPRLRALGLRDDTIAELKVLAFPIPGVGDLIRMGVREVFTPEIAERFGQFEDFPTDILPFTKASGLTEEWTRNFWAAHWELPSPNQGFEMLHRKVIDPDDLDKLLRALDVMPFWRQPLIDIAFRPLTRVDLRRMHRLELLDEDDLQLRYEDLGFNPDNAALMVKFTIAFNAPPDKDKEREPNAFTRTQIVQFFRRGIFTETEATAGLVAIGWSIEGAQTIIDNEIIAQDDRTRTRAVRLIERRFVKGFIDRADVFEQLDALEITEIERAELVSEMEAKQIGRAHV